MVILALRLVIFMIIFARLLFLLRCVGEPICKHESDVYMTASVWDTIIRPEI